jgi:hypothetical protein
MVRLLIAVAVGYGVMTVLVLAAFSLALLAPGFAFQPETCDVTPEWLVWTLATGLAAATAGGFVAVAVARRRQAAWVLAGLVLVLGLLSAGMSLTHERPPSSASAAGLSVVERARRAVQPTWYAISLPFLGACGVLAGGLVHREGRAVATS